MDRIYLDTHQWNYLVNNPERTPEELATLRRCLQERVKESRLAVVSSLPLLQEIMGAERKLPTKYAQMRELIFDVTRNRWLLPLNERYRREVGAGGALSESSCYLDRATRRSVKSLSTRNEGLTTIADQTYEQTNQFKQEQEGIRAKLLTELPERTGSNNVCNVIQEWWSTVEVDEWLAEMVDEHVTPQLLSSDRTELRTKIPSAWLFTAFKLARVKLNLGEGRSIKPSDYIDAEHCAAGAYYDVLVTDDSAFRSTCEMLDTCPFQIETFDDLVGRLSC